MNIEEPNDLIPYLIDQGWLASGEVPKMEILRGGVSNRTVWLRRSTGEAWVLKQALDKLRVVDDWFSDPIRIEREALGIKHLSRLLPAGTVPGLIFSDPQHFLLCMEAVTPPFENYKTLLLKGRAKLNYFHQFGHTLGLVHQRGIKESKKFQKIFEDTSFFESLRLEPYYEFTAQRMPIAGPFLRALIKTCRSDRYTVVHGDYSPKNILFRKDKLVLLDHEVIHYGDGTFDIGFALSHLLSKANHLKPHRQFLQSGAILFWEAYAKHDPEITASREDRAVKHTLACLLARVLGRSPLEYLTKPQQQIQVNIVSSLLDSSPATVPDLIAAFTNHLK